MKRSRARPEEPPLTEEELALLEEPEDDGPLPELYRVRDSWRFPYCEDSLWASSVFLYMYLSHVTIAQSIYPSPVHSHPYELCNCSESYLRCILYDAFGLPPTAQSRPLPYL